MGVSASIHMDNESEANIVARSFETLPRIGETVIFQPMRPWSRQEVNRAAYCTVTRVEHNVYVDDAQVDVMNRLDVHAFVFVKPRSDEDMAALLQLFPELEEEMNAD